MPTIQIDIVSDIACPWCAIGYARLEQAMASLQTELQFTVEWHAFELNPDPALQPEPILPALAKKYGRSEAEMAASQANMMQIATDLGVNFSKLQQRFTCNTFDAHRLVKWAAPQGKATQMKQALFDAYFGHAANVADHCVLLDCVAAIGLNISEAESVLSGNAFADVVRADEAKYQQAGISSVPAFIINQKYLISGAQEPAQFIAAFRQIAAEN